LYILTAFTEFLLQSTKQVNISTFSLLVNGIIFWCVIYLFSTCCDDKLLITEWMLFSVLKRTGAFHLVFHWPILRSQMFTFAILVSYVSVKMWNISRNIDFFNMILWCKMIRGNDISKKNTILLKKKHLHFLGSSWLMKKMKS